jgi:50S ribosomal protein L16 3-hydroxylase
LTLIQFNNSFDKAGFLSSYWQQKPLLIKQMLPNFSDPISPEELAGLSMELGTESRLVEGVDPAHWQMSEGPFTEERFTSLPQDGWTLLVQAVDHWVEEVQELMQLFDFVPSWRIDDVMVSFAAHGAGVGPHYDYYDVFLIQGLGQRTWKIGKKCSSADVTSNRAGLSILEQFEEVEEITLQTGDVLYIPPQYSHWGVSDGRSLCYSVGCRAPSLAEMIEGFSDTLIDNALPEDRYTDPMPQAPTKRGEIALGNVEESFNKLMELIDSKSNYCIWFGCNTTRPKYPNLIVAPEQDYTIESLIQELAEGCSLVMNPSSRFAFCPLPCTEITALFVDGECAQLSNELSWFAQAMCDQSLLKQFISKLLETPKALDHTLRYLNQGSLVTY